MKTVIIRNIERLIYATTDTHRDPIEPMTAYKWHRLHTIAKDFGIVPWLIDGLRIYQDDFFLQIPDTIRQDILTTTDPKDSENLTRFELYAERSIGLRYKLSRKSLKAYAQDLIQKITNVEE